jgi:amino-acid N-acetyltransferase
MAATDRSLLASARVAATCWARDRIASAFPASECRARESRLSPHLRALVSRRAPYIHAYHGKTFVVAMAGELIAAGKLNAFVQDLAILHAMGIKLVLGARLQAAGQRATGGQGPRVSRFSHGLRITDSVALDAAQEAAGQLRFEIEAAFSQGLPNTPMANATVRVVSGQLPDRAAGRHRRRRRLHPQRPRAARSTTAAIRRAIDIGALVLLSPFGFSPTGEAFNLTMEDVATSTAIALQADKLVFLTEIPGIRETGRRPREPDRHRARARRRQAPAGDACRRRRSRPTPPSTSSTACARARAASSARTSCRSAPTARCLLEVFTHDGIGTMVVDEKLESCARRRPTTSAGILQLIEPFERDGTARPPRAHRDRADVAIYTVIEHDGIIFGCVALYPYPEARTGEMPR